VKSKQKTVFVWIVDPKNSKPVKSKHKKQQNPNKNARNPNNYKICEIQTIQKQILCFDFANFSLDFAVFYLDFPDFLFGFPVCPMFKLFKIAFP
jgi:hypothetical protein